MPVGRIDTGDGATFLISAGIVYEIIAAACSSPQTAEINASSRAGTLMKWVHLGLAQSAAFIAVAVLIEPQRAKPILAGGVGAATVMYVSYQHALRAGLKSVEVGTEGASPRYAALGMQV
jgi:uncharacterized membrane protein